jgi:predicted dehydrogenase
MRIGLVGCGNIAPAYIQNSKTYFGYQVVACADLISEAALSFADRYGIKALSFDALFESVDIDIILNLAPPAAHEAVLRRAMNDGKHVYTETPLTVSFGAGVELVALAEARGLRIGAAPDTFLGGAGRIARELLDGGEIGTPLSGVATFMSHGMEHWHPGPDHFYKAGAGPLFDMGPYYLTSLVSLLGPVSSVAAMGQRGFKERTIAAPASPRIGQSMPVETFTHIQALVQFDNGAQVTLLTSWDVWKHGLPPIEIHGTEGSMRLPDPNGFGGPVMTAKGRTDWTEHDTAHLPFSAMNWPSEAPAIANYRGLGLADMVAAIREDRPHRADGRLALHVVEIMEAALVSAASGGSPQLISSRCPRPAPMVDKL